MEIGDVTFCQSTSHARLFAVAVEARVDIYNLSQPEENPENSEDEDPIKHRTRLQKFEDSTTAIQLRQDGNLMLAGEKSGRIQLFELSKKYTLRQYTEHSNRVNSICWAQNNKNFLSCANETSIRYWDIQSPDTTSVVSIMGAHSDNIKKV